MYGHPFNHYPQAVSGFSTSVARNLERMSVDDLYTLQVVVVCVFVCVCARLESVLASPPRWRAAGMLFVCCISVCMSVDNLYMLQVCCLVLYLSPSFSLSVFT
jgi:hypothetical protein